MEELNQLRTLLSEKDYQLLLSISAKKTTKRKAVVFHPNKVADKILFIEKGFLRGYKIMDGKEFTHHFYFSNWFATDFESFLTEQPSQIYIEAVEDTVYYEFHKKRLLEVYSQSHELESLGRMIAEKAYIATVEKLSNMQLYKLNERYERLIERHPILIQKVPQKHIASYLGVSEQSLSRIKKQ